jgi:hypothetical protein
MRPWQAYTKTLEVPPMRSSPGGLVERYGGGVGASPLVHVLGAAAAAAGERGVHDVRRVSDCSSS